MTDILTLPVLPLDDMVVLPGMVVPMRLADAEVRAAIDAARAVARARTPQTGGHVLLVPRLDGKYAGVGTVATIEQIGRCPAATRSPSSAASTGCAIGTGATGPGAALWVEATVQVEPPARPARRRSGPRVQSRWPPRSCSSAAAGSSSTPCSR